jgi:hypothetical protein
MEPHPQKRLEGKALVHPLVYFVCKIYFQHSIFSDGNLSLISVPGSICGFLLSPKVVGCIKAEAAV